MTDANDNGPYFLLYVFKGREKEAGWTMDLACRNSETGRTYFPSVRTEEGDKILASVRVSAELDYALRQLGVGQEV